MRVLVELSWVSRGLLVFSSSGIILFASTLPSSTPHWSNELIECMLTCCARLSPDDRSSLIIHLAPFQVNMLAIALHVELLQVGTQPFKVLVVWQDSDRFGPKEIIVPDTNQT